MNTMSRSRYIASSLGAVCEQAFSRRLFGSSSVCQADELKSAFAAALPAQQERLKRIKKEHGAEPLHAVTVNMAIGGMRGITGLLYETSLLDADEGIRFRGHSIPELQVRACAHSRSSYMSS